MLYNEKDSDTNEATVQRYVNILSNAGFKAFFGDVNNKEAVISILNVLLPGIVYIKRTSESKVN